MAPKHGSTVVSMLKSTSAAAARRPKVLILGLDIGGWKVSSQFILCVFGVFVLFLVYGVLQEKVTGHWKRHGGVHLGWWLTFCQCLVYSSTMMVVRWTTGESSAKQSRKHSPKAPMPRAYLAAIGVLSVSTIGLSNMSIEYLNYPTQVMFKCSKPVPVMLMGIVILRKRYSLAEYFATGMLTAGLIVFSTADKIVSASFNPVGIGIICTALFIDGIIGNVQQRAFTRYECSTSEMICWNKASLPSKAIGTL